MASSSAVQLDHWANVLAPLTEAERASVNAVAEWVGAIGGGTRGVGLSSSSRGGETPQDAANKAPFEERSRLRKHHDEAPSYLAWYAEQEALMAAANQRDEERALQEVRLAADEADELLDHFEAARAYIAELRAGAQVVEEGTEGLREDAESMVERIDHLSQLAEALALRLSYFAILPASTSFLSSPSLSLVITKEFELTLHRLDIALAFVRAHPHYRDAPLYKMRFEHCIVRAGTLTRMYVVGRFKELTANVSFRLKEWDRSNRQQIKEKEKGFDADEHVMMTLGDPPVAALLWDRFEEEGIELQKLLGELETRASIQAPPAATDIEGVTQALLRPSTVLNGSRGEKSGTQETDSDDPNTEVFRAPEFATLLEECRTAYFEARQSLLGAMIANCVARIEVLAVQQERMEDGSGKTSSSSNSAEAKQSPTVRLITRAMALLSAVFKSEVTLYSRFFSISTEDGQSLQSLTAFLQILTSSLDDRIRPRVAREATLPGLASICRSLVEGADLENASMAIVASALGRTILKEAQDKLVERAKASIAGTEIGRYTPKEEDLDYPVKLRKNHRRIQSIGGAGLLEAAADADVSIVSEGGDTSLSVDQSRSDIKRPETPSGSTSGVRLFASPAKPTISTWYPPLVITLTVLRLTHDSLPYSAFADVARQAIDQCRANVMNAGQIMASHGGLAGGRIGASGKMDVPLFLLRHLLLLREMTASVELRRTNADAFVVERRQAAISGRSFEIFGLGGGGGGARGGILEFGQLVNALNSLWTGLTGGAGALAANAAISIRPGGAVPATEADTQAQTTTTTKEEGGNSQSFPRPNGSRSAQLEKDLATVSAQLVNIVAQGVSLPLRVYMDQRARARHGRKSSMDSPNEIATPGSPNTERRLGHGGQAAENTNAGAAATTPTSATSGTTTPTSSTVRPPRGPRRSSSSFSFQSPAAAAANSPLTRARSALQSFDTCAQTNLGEARQALRLYLDADPRALDSIAQPIVGQICETYASFVDKVHEAGIEDSHLLPTVMQSVEECRARMLSLIV